MLAGIKFCLSIVKERSPTILDKVGSGLLKGNKIYHCLSGKPKLEAKQLEIKLYESRGLSFLAEVSIKYL